MRCPELVEGTKTVVIVGSLDTKGEEFAFVKDLIEKEGLDTLVVDFGVMGEPGLEPDVKREEVAEAFLKASFEGWIWCRDNFDPCVEVVLDNAPTLGVSHQTWQLNEINGLIWPSPDGIGVMDQDLWDQTVEVATSQGILESEPSDGAFRRDLAEKALEELEDEDLDVNGGAEPNDVAMLILVLNGLPVP